jgi:3-(3-hydroxy-phenyl)propionate hydroxylase
LKIKPPHRFVEGLFLRGKTRSKLVRGGPFPQGLVRLGVGAAITPSDEALGHALALVGFGCDPTLRLSTQSQAAWTRAGGRVIPIRYRGQLGLPDPAWEDMNDCLVPNAAPVGWVAVVRPDRTVLHDGPIGILESIVSESLKLLGGDHPLRTPSSNIDLSPPPVSAL